jgi:hypothetical protein
MRVFMEVCAFCGDETLVDECTHALIDQFRAHRNVQRAHTTREILIIPSSL